MQYHHCFEQRFKTWLEEHSINWTRLVIPRKVAYGAAAAHILLPQTEIKRVVVLVHGTGNDALYPHIGLFKHLLSNGCAICSFDLDGHGRHSTTLFAPQSIRSAVACAVELFKRELGFIDFHLLGHSLGAVLSAEAIRTEEVKPCSVILMNMPLSISLSRLRVDIEILSFITGKLWQEREHYGLSELLPAAGPFRRSAFPLRLAAKQEGTYVRQVQNLINELGSGLAHSHFTCPSLLLYGALDRLAPWTDGVALKAKLRHSQLVVIANAGHLTTLTSMVTFNSIVDWLEALNKLEVTYA